MFYCRSRRRTRCLLAGVGV
ncbi:hypothetical protein BM221_010859 [Beauveria bassiana]|uniref:Uncharacterized protein n=1 Tax=Beauveria bassiana TaxID=176275 RepID=A0A2N6N7S4_BEABA|nr:hypothetical protein BM221_010870 [Beauveria bassiana]PMB63330.1 hypothetical protein BM221_010859 [Beauveria bassiana]